MKLVINKCYGGFGLSPIAQKRYLKLVGKECFFYKQTKYKFDGGVNEYTRLSMKEATKCTFCDTVTEDLGKTTTDIGRSKNSKHPDVYWYYGNIERNDPLLVKVVEELGCDAASAQLAELEIVDIPDDVEYTINEYDGIESVHESHRSW
jgi:hypothetical protein